MFGPIAKKINMGLADLNPREIALMIPLAVMMFFMGIYPQPFLSKMEPTVTKIIDGAQQEAFRADSAVPEIRKNRP